MSCKQGNCTKKEEEVKKMQVSEHKNKVNEKT